MFGKPYTENGIGISPYTTATGYGYREPVEADATPEGRIRDPGTVQRPVYEVHGQNIAHQLYGSETPNPSELP